MEQDLTSSPVGTPPLQQIPHEDSLPNIVNINQMVTPDLSFDSGASSSPAIPPRSARHASPYRSLSSTLNKNNASSTSLNPTQRSHTPPAVISTPASTWQSSIPSFSENQQLPTAASPSSTVTVASSSNSSPIRRISVDVTSSSPSHRNSQVTVQASSSPNKSITVFDSSTPVLSSSSHNRCISQRTVQPLDHSISSPTFNSSKTTVYGDPLSTQKSTLSNKNKSNSQNHSSKRTDQTNIFNTQDIQAQLSLSLNDYLYYRGFLRGEGSDVTVRCFNRNFKLHKFILSRSPYFSSLFSSFWESSSQSSPEKKPIHTLSMDHDENITECAFELAISRLYGHEDIEEERKNIFGLFAVANFLDLPSLVDICVTEIISRISHTTVANILHFFHKRNYGEASKTIVEACKNFLFAEGYEMSFDLWMTIPNKVIAEVVGSDAFFVPTEWERCQFLIQIINLRILNAKSCSEQNETDIKDTNNLDSEDMAALRSTLDHDIRYCHMTYDQLEALEHTRDVNNHLIISRVVLREALWLQIGLKQKVIRVSDDCTELGIVREVPAGKLYGYDDEDEEEDSYSDENDDLKNNEIDSRSLGSSPTAKVKRFDNESPKRSGDTSATTENSSFISDDEEDVTYYSIPNADETLDAPWDRVKNHLDQPTKITKFPPFRFAVKFNDATLLENDRRVYSHTYWYAGNFWNVYLQKVAYKNKHQLGVYIHRSPPDSFIDPNLRVSSNSALTTSFINPLKYGVSNTGLGNAFVSSDFRRRSMGTYPGVSSTLGRIDDTPVDLRAGAGAGAEVPLNSIINESFSEGVNSAAAAASNNMLNLSTMISANNSNTRNNGIGAASSSSSVISNGVPSEIPQEENLGEISNMNTNINRDVALASLEHGGNDAQIFDTLLENLSLRNETAENGVGAELSQDTINVLSSLSLANAENVGDLTMIHQQIMSTPVSSQLNSLSGFQNKPGFVLSKQAQVPEYIDKRKKVSAFFEIYTPSRKGHSSLTCFSSTPDMFNISQSWGWKSASLYLKAEELKKGGKNDGLKFMVSIGLV
ncbi:uncharacterized protein SAPINGB_P002722 [Magnusiomyces paraingens]|uniref:BTB domain-containing protein n=1 Tax=Magnusiomyces paraingens TaxID=2606893 RepID=A0A5E8BFF3_9ASCO|nr:uncharacterized protein SAPINGB_P002722 [Saprochaete ingens]VVT50356.1 unnamed protein product [Saprochaete ingens]